MAATATIQAREEQHASLLLALDQVRCELGGISATGLWRELAPRGDLPSLRIGRRRFVRRADLEAFIERRRQEALTMPEPAVAVPARGAR